LARARTKAWAKDSQCNPSRCNGSHSMTNDPRPQGGAFGPSHQIDQNERRAELMNDLAVLRRQQPQPMTDDNIASTYMAHTHDESGGRFAQINKQNISGSKPTVEYNAGPNWSRDPVPPEPTIDCTDCGDTFGIALGEFHEQHSQLPASSTVSVEGSEGAPSDPPSRAPSSTHIVKRRI
jgi:hypothetical protein